VATYHQVFRDAEGNIAQEGPPAWGLPQLHPYTGEDADFLVEGEEIVGETYDGCRIVRAHFHSGEPVDFLVRE
jgi:hypothetical protein